MVNMWTSSKSCIFISFIFVYMYRFVLAGKWTASWPMRPRKCVFFDEFQGECFISVVMCHQSLYKYTHTPIFITTTKHSDVTFDLVLKLCVMLLL